MRPKGFCRIVKFSGLKLGHSNAIKTQNWWRTNFSDFWRRPMQLPSSPNSSTEDYDIWCNFKRATCLTSCTNVDALKSTVNKKQAKMSMVLMLGVCINHG